jgi:hypothetical protein
MNAQWARLNDSPRPTWTDLVAEEPRLAALLEEARGYRKTAKPTFCANAVWYGYGSRGEPLKDSVSRLVGWERKEHPLLGTEGAYDVAYETIYEALPNCRHEGWC